LGKFVRGGRIVPAERVGVLAEAEEIMARAREQAAEILAEAREEAAAIRQGARKQGLEAGKSEVLSELAKARAERQRLLAGMQHDVVALALDVARKVIHREIGQSPEIVAEICSRALTRLVSARALEVRIHPEDLPVVEDRREVLAANAVAGANLEFVADWSVERGGCVIESESGRVDARLDTQLAALEKALLEEGDD